MVNVKVTIEQENDREEEEDVVWIYLVGMVFEGKFAVSLFDLAVVCVLGDPQYPVVICTHVCLFFSCRYLLMCEGGVA